MRKQSNIFFLFSYLKDYLYNLLIVFLSIIGVSFTILSIGKIVKELVNNGVYDSHYINGQIILLFCVSIILGLCSFLRSYFIYDLSERIINRLRYKLFEKLLHKEISYYEEISQSDLVTRLTSDLKLIASLINNTLSYIVRNILMLLGCLILMFFQSIYLSLIVIIATTLLILPILILAKRLKKISKNYLHNEGYLNNKLYENFSAMRLIHSYNRQDKILKNFEEFLKLYYQSFAQRLLARSSFFGIVITLVLCTVISLIWFGLDLVLRHSLTSGQVLAFLYYAIIAASSAIGMAEVFSEISLPIAALNRVMALSNENNNGLKTKPRAFHSTSKNLKISFKNVSFAYPTRLDQLILANISLDIDLSLTPYVIIFGKSGTGKSTILELLLGFYPIEQGQIHLFNSLVDKDSRDYFRSQMAYLPQRLDVFSGTIKDNILFAADDVNDVAIDKALKLCGLTDFVNGLADGIKTDIGQGAQLKLSGGQLQRLGLARTLLSGAKILLLDEALNAIPTLDEQTIISSLLETGYFIISVSHRLSSLAKANKVIFLSKDAAVLGTHDELLTIQEYRILYEDYGVPE